MINLRYTPHWDDSKHKCGQRTINQRRLVFASHEKQIELGEKINQISSKSNFEVGNIDGISLE